MGWGEFEVAFDSKNRVGVKNAFRQSSAFICSLTGTEYALYNSARDVLSPSYVSMPRYVDDIVRESFLETWSWHKSRMELLHVLDHGQENYRCHHIYFHRDLFLQLSVSLHKALLTFRPISPKGK